MNRFRKLIAAATLMLVGQLGNAQLLNFRTLTGFGSQLDSVGAIAQLNQPRHLSLSIDKSRLIFAEAGRQSIGGFDAVRAAELATRRTRKLAGSIYNTNSLTGGAAFNANFNTPQAAVSVGDSLVYITNAGQSAGNFGFGGLSVLNLKTNTVTVINLNGAPNQNCAAIAVSPGLTFDTLYYTNNYGSSGGLNMVLVNKTTFAVSTRQVLIPTQSASPDGLGRGEGVVVVGDSIYVADYNRGRIYVTGLSVPSYRVLATNLGSPYGLTRLDDTTLLATDYTNNRINAIDIRTGISRVFATGLNRPYGISVKDTMIYVSESESNRIRTARLAAPNNWSVFVGNGLQFVNGRVDVASFTSPGNGSLGANNTLYIGDRNSGQIRAVNLDSGAVRAVVNVSSIRDVVFKDSVLYYVQNARNGIFRISSYNLRTGRSSVLAGQAFTGPAGAQVDGDSATSQLKYPQGLVIDASGRNLYFASGTANNNEGGFAIRRVNLATKITTTIAGPTTPTPGYLDGVGAAARIGAVSDMTILGDTVIYFVDQTNYRIRKIDLRSFEVTTIAGAGGQTQNPADNANGILARFANVKGIVADTVNNTLYVTDNNLVRRIRLSGTREVRTVGGSTNLGMRDGLGTAAQFANPYGLVLDSGSRALYVLDIENARIRKATFFVNTAPSYAMGPDTSALENSSLVTINNWATNISGGSNPEEATQLVRFRVSNNNPALFLVQPRVDSLGRLIFRPAINRYGVARVSIRAFDNGGTEAGGVDTTSTTFFNIRIDSVNSAPVFTLSAANRNITANTGVASYNNATWATAVAASGAPNFEQWQTLQFSFRTKRPELYTVLPTAVVTGTGASLTFVPSRILAGNDTLTVVLKDNGGIALGGVDTVVTTLIIRITPYVNQRPAFTVSAANSNLQYPALTTNTATTVTGFATAISVGPSAESWQTPNISIRSFNPSIYDVLPAGVIVGSGTSRTANLTFTLNGNPGVDTLYVIIKDDGGAAFGGVDSLLRKTVIRVTPNAAPTFTVSTANTTLNYPQNSTQSVNITNWATAVTAGPALENPQTLTFIVRSRNLALYSTPPSVAVVGTTTRTGTLSFSLAGVNGRDTLDVILKDNGGILGGGVDTLVRQVFVNVGQVSLAELLPASDISIYPVPVRDVLTLDLTALANQNTVNVRLTTMTGQTLTEMQINPTERSTMDVSGLANGVYLLHLSQDGKHLVKRISKN